MITVGAQSAICALVGEQIGANQVATGKTYLKVISMIMLVVILCAQCALHFGKTAIIGVFTNDSGVQALAASTFWVMAIVTIVDTFQGGAQGVIRALGLQKQASYIALAAYYIVTIPLACLLCFVGSMNVAGLWIGVLAGCFL